LQVIEATCPLVHLAHRSVQKLVQQGYHPVIIGRRDHVEVRGMTGDLDEYDVVLTEDEVAALQPRPRLGIVAQTTQPIDHVRALVRCIQQGFPSADVRFVDTVCQPTKQRQHAAGELAQHCDVVVVIGGANSNNTRELVRTCSAHCSRVHHIQTAADLHPEWFRETDTVGLTAGTSTPDAVIDGVETQLKEWGVWAPSEPAAAHAH
jgi:4-hydroxy-3-methylbut-2-enyl diphosphate reductase